MIVEPLPVAILAGGLATRMRPLTEKLPKSMLPVAGRPFIHSQLKLLKDKGLRRVVLCLGHLGGQVEEYVKSGAGFGLETACSYDGPNLLGTAGALRAARPLLGEAFFVLYGDSYLDCDYLAAQAAFERSGRPALMTVFHNRGRHDRSNTVFENGEILAYSKTRPRPDMEHIDYGLGVMKAEALEGRDADLADVYSRLAAEGRLAGLEIFERFYEIGSPAGLAELERRLAG